MLIEYGIARRKPAMPRAIPLVRPTLLAAALCAANLAVAAQPASAPFTPAQQQAIRQISASAAQAQVPLVASAAAASVAKTIEGEKEAIDVAKDALEVGRKSVDWWLTVLGLIMALAGIGLSVWLSRKHDEVEVKLKEADAAKQKAEIALRNAEQLIESFSKQTSLVPSSEQLIGSQVKQDGVSSGTDSASEKLSSEVLEKLQKIKPPQVVKLIKQAWDAQHREDWQAALPLWSLLSLIESQDSNVWFSLGVVHSEGSQNWDSAAECFERSNLLDPHPSTLFNWANCIHEQGRFSKQSDKLREAIAKYREAYTLHKNFSEAYFQRAVTLVELASREVGSEQQAHFAEAKTDYENAIKYGFQVKRTVYEQLVLLMVLWANSLADPERQEKLDAAANYKKQAEQAL